MIDTDQLAASVRLAPCARPPGKPAGYHCWHDLLFVHWRLSPEVLRPFVPAALELDTWEGDAWLGIVAFRMSGVRPRWFPALPGVSAFAETNLRTYVHHQGQAPGVLFLSLDAAHRLAVRIARWRWRLPYYFARMGVAKVGGRVEYRSSRNSQSGQGRTNLAARLLAEPVASAPGFAQLATEPAASAPGFFARPLPDGRGSVVGAKPVASAPVSAHSRRPVIAPRPAAPGTLEFFLAERYFMYVPGLTSRRDEVRRGQVHHSPYELVPAELLVAEESLSTAAGLPDLPTPSHAMYSAGVSVEVFPLKRLERGKA